ncbi:DUF6000 family protein [Streptomyces sp. NPDC014983]|uniref:DUF6000 family protein n=1 Tax=Streptomyces sp. NPDC014983 TaxID=3364933 RepID=UPI0036FA3E59
MAPGAEAPDPRCPAKRIKPRFALARLDPHADTETLTAYLHHCLPRTDLHYDRPAAPGALLQS